MRSTSVPMTRSAYWIYHTLECQEGRPAKPPVPGSLSSLARASAVHRPHPLRRPTRSSSCKKHLHSSIAIPMRLSYPRRSVCRACRSRPSEAQLQTHNAGTRTLRHQQHLHPLPHDDTLPPSSPVPDDRFPHPIPAEASHRLSRGRMQHTWCARQHGRHPCPGHRVCSPYGRSRLHARHQKSSVVAAPIGHLSSPGHLLPRPATRKICQTGGRHIRRTRLLLGFIHKVRGDQPLLLRQPRKPNSTTSVVTRQKRVCLYAGKRKFTTGLTCRRMM